MLYALNSSARSSASSKYSSRGVTRSCEQLNAFGEIPVRMHLLVFKTNSSTSYNWNRLVGETQRGWRAGIHTTGPEWLLMTSLTREYISLTVSPVTIAEIMYDKSHSRYSADMLSLCRACPVKTNNRCSICSDWHNSVYLLSTRIHQTFINRRLVLANVNSCKFISSCDYFRFLVHLYRSRFNFAMPAPAIGVCRSDWVRFCTFIPREWRSDDHRNVVNSLATGPLNGFEPNSKFNVGLI